MYKIAHRGASGYELENSFQSLRKAFDLGADVIEADVQVTMDDVPIIMHDRLLDRTTNTSGYTFDFAWKDYEAGIRLKNGDPVPSLEDYCREVKEAGKILYLDVKSLGCEGDILHTCQKFLSNDQFLIGSFHYYAIKLIKQMDASARTAMIIEGNPIDIVQVVNNTSCDVVAMGFDTIEEDSIQTVQEMGKQAFVWVVNDEREIKRAKALGVDGITSDFPERL